MALLKVEHLKVNYPIRGNRWGQRQWLHAVDDVSFELNPGETLALVGESGCGKSTIAKALVHLEPLAGGKVWLDNEDWGALSGGALRRRRKEIQMIFQDPYGSLNPRLTLRSTLEEVLKLHTDLDGAGRLRRIGELLEMVGLKAEYQNRYPHQFSGGQRQRIGIARALAAEPRVLIADEPVSALDVSVQAAIINLLEDIQSQTHTALLFIAHDLGVVEHISDRIMVMYLGRIVECGPARELCSAPQHPYTRALLSAVPTLAQNAPQRILLPGDVPSPLAPPAGCAFHPRCAYATDLCRLCRPELQDCGERRQTACCRVEELTKLFAATDAMRTAPIKS